MVPVASEFKRVPGLKKILEDGIEVILRKQMENHAEVVVYKNGYVSYHRTMVRWWALLSAADLWRGGWMMAIRWKSIACVRMELQTLAVFCMRRRTVQHGQWATTKLSPTFWIRKMEHP